MNVDDDANRIYCTDLGEMEYGAAWKLQEHYFQRSVDHKIGRNRLKGLPAPRNYLFLCEHPSVFTLGKSGSEHHLLADAEQMKQQGIALFRNNRGGDITYHGPGQIVGYPILDLEQFRPDIRAYMRSLEEVIIRTIADYGLKGERLDDAVGIWLDTDQPHRTRKICAFGVKTSRWVTMHGFALNVNTDLRFFDLIVPCGISDKGVTSLERELGGKVPLPEVKAALLGHFSDVFSAYIEELPAEYDEGAI